MDDEGDPAGGLAVDEDDPVEAVPSVAPEVVGPAGGELGADLRSGERRQRLVAADALLGPPEVEQRGVLGARRPDLDLGAQRPVADGVGGDGAALQRP